MPDFMAGRGGAVNGGLGLGGFGVPARPDLFTFMFAAIASLSPAGGEGTLKEPLRQPTIPGAPSTSSTIAMVFNSAFGTNDEISTYSGSLEP
jgi:hypothetical protein